MYFPVTKGMTINSVWSRDAYTWLFKLLKCGGLS